MRRGRRKKVRYVQTMPDIAQFSPRGRPGRPDEVELWVDHVEALKLADFQGYDQSEGARFMGVSRPTFGRILREARQIVAGAIVGGKMIRIRTGDVQVGVRQRSLPLKRGAGSAIQKESAARTNILNYKSTKG